MKIYSKSQKNSKINLAHGWVSPLFNSLNWLRKTFLYIVVIATIVNYQTNHTHNSRLCYP